MRLHNFYMGLRPGATNAFWTFLIVLTTIRALFLAFSPLELAPDEAYYWDWSRHLSFGYYSKPPLIAWIIWLGTHVLGPTEIGVRLPALVMGTISLYLLYKVAQEIKGPETAFWSVLLSGLTIGANVSAYIMTIDAPLLFFWNLSLFTTWKALNDRRHHAMWWILSGAFVGLGLLSKQTMVAFPFLIFLFLLIERAYRPHLTRPLPYVSFLIAVLFLVPTLIWNMHHGWITLVHTTHHFSPNRHGAIEGVKTFMALFGGLFGILTPVTFCLVIAGAIWALKNIKRLDAGERFLFFLGPLPLIFVLLLALHQRVNPNWPAPFFITSTILGAHWGMVHGKRLLKTATVVGGILVALMYLSPFLLPRLPIYGGKLDPYLRLRGWKELAGHIASTLETEKKHREIKYVFAFPRQVVSELAFYMDGQPQIYMWKADRRIKSQYDLWESPFSKKEAFYALIIKPDKKRLRPSQIYLFKSITPVKHVRLHGLPPDRGGYWIYVGEYDPGTR